MAPTLLSLTWDVVNSLLLSAQFALLLLTCSLSVALVATEGNSLSVLLHAEDNTLCPDSAQGSQVKDIALSLDLRATCKVCSQDLRNSQDLHGC